MWELRDYRVRARPASIPQTDLEKRSQAHTYTSDVQMTLLYGSTTQGRDTGSGLEVNLQITRPVNEGVKCNDSLADIYSVESGLPMGAIVSDALTWSG